MMAQAEKSVVLERLHASAQRALRSQTPARLVAYSVDVDPAQPVLHLKAHFSSAPTEDEIEMLQGVETEILADFEDEFETQTEVDVVPAHTTPGLLRGGVVFRRHRA
ncbi:hypothetical protein J4558_26880 [Leptolyngbya sp. 15MV]|nr:hypothetical protein J4558_26880 [Leptolyngbya sp. 15MV]